MDDVVLFIAAFREEMFCFNLLLIGRTVMDTFGLAGAVLFVVLN